MNDERTGWMFRPEWAGEYVRFTPPTAIALWFVGALGIGMIAWGGRLLRPGLLLWFVGAWVLLAEEALNVKAHDRLLLWVALGLFLSPASEPGLVNKWRSPAACGYLLVVFGAIYGSTGLMKLLYGVGWWNGRVMQLHLVHQHHAGGALASWVSGQRWLTTPMGWWTLLFELSFPVLVLFRRTNPWVLMNVGAFSFVSLAAYPVLLHPEEARRTWLALSGWWAGRSAPA